MGNEGRLQPTGGQETGTKISARPRGLGRLVGVNAPIPLVAFFPGGDWASCAAPSPGLRRTLHRRRASTRYATSLPGVRNRAPKLVVSGSDPFTNASDGTH